MTHRTDWDTKIQGAERASPRSHSSKTEVRAGLECRASNSSSNVLHLTPATFLERVRGLLNSVLLVCPLIPLYLLPHPPRMRHKDLSESKISQCVTACGVQGRLGQEKVGEVAGFCHCEAWAYLLLITRQLRAWRAFCPLRPWPQGATGQRGPWKLCHPGICWAGLWHL